MRDDRLAALLRVAIGPLAVIAVAILLVPLRDTTRNANVAMALMVVVVAAAVRGGRVAGATTAIASALAFDFFHTEPYLRFRIVDGDDIETTVLLLVVGLVVGQIAAEGRIARRSAEKSQGEIRRIYRVASLGARGEAAADVIMAAQGELVDVLRLRDCRFEAPPFGPALQRLERSGAVAWPPRRPPKGGLELPAEGVELTVLGRGQVLGRFVLDPTPGVGLSLEQRVVAVALADQVGAVLAAPQHGGPRVAYG